MNTAAVDKIVNAVLYEGYILYPYRPSIKNARRTMFGGVYPRWRCDETGGAERWWVQAECLVEGTEATTIAAQARFLHSIDRRIGRRAASAGADGAFELLDRIEIDGRRLDRWQEVAERRIDAGPRAIGELLAGRLRVEIVCPPGRSVEAIESAESNVQLAWIREQQRIEAAVELSARRLSDGVFSVRVGVFNTAAPPADAGQRGDGQPVAMHSTHAILSVAGGRFVSSVDPPASVRPLAAELRNEGIWPVLVGRTDDRDTMLASPIILYDYPQVAEESTGDFFDATEIDAMLGLRVATLTDDEKQWMRSVDPRARQILERTERLPPGESRNLHGAIRGLRRVDLETESG